MVANQGIQAAKKTAGRTKGSKMAFETKFSLQSFLKQVNKLTTRQRISIERVGFGNVLLIPNQILRRYQLVELMERWCCEKQAFVLRPGEITISLMDVALILGLRIIGDPVVLNNAPFSELEREFGASLSCRRVTVGSLKDRLESLGEEDNENFVRSFLLYTFGTLLFPTPNGKVDSRYLFLLRDLEKVSNFAWGAAVHSDLLYSLSQRKTKNVQCIRGCLILLQIWCYEHIKVGRPIMLNRSFPRSCRWEKITRAYITANEDREVFATLFRNLEHNQILWELKVTSEEAEMEFVKELIERQEYSSVDVSIDKEDSSRTNFEMFDKWVDLVTKSYTNLGIHEEQEHLVRQPHDTTLFPEKDNDSTPSTSYHMHEIQIDQQRQRVSHANQEVSIIRNDENGRTDFEMLDKWVDLATESNTNLDIHEEQEDLVRQPQNSTVFLEKNRDSTPSTCYQMQGVQVEQQRLLHVNQEVFIISDDDEGDSDARNKTLEEQIITLKNEIEELRKENSCVKKLEEENLQLRQESDSLKRELCLFRLSRQRIYDRLEKTALGEDVHFVEFGGSNLKEQS